MTTTKPLPGSDEAVRMGCKCPVRENHNGLGAWGGGPTGATEPRFWVRETCPVHGRKRPRSEVAMSSRFSGQYTSDWKEIAKQVKDEADWRCVRCGHPHDPAAGYTLTVHHLTGEKDQNAWWNTAALCQRCHLKIQAKVIMHRPWFLSHSDWFKPFVAGYYAHVHGLPDDKESVLANMDALIALGQQGGNGQC